MEATTRLIDISIDDLRRIIIDIVGEAKTDIYYEIESRLNREEKPKSELKGIVGISIALNCSLSKAAKLKAAGMLEGGYIQIGKTIIVPDPDKLRAIAQSRQNEAKDARRKGRRINYSLMDKQ